MRRHLLWAVAIFAVLIFTDAPASAQQVLPSSFGGWNATARGNFAPEPNTTLDQGAVVFAGQAIAAAKEYGFVSGEQGSYARGDRALQVQFYRMKDPSGAYGEYSYLRTPDMLHATFTGHSSMSRERALVLIGDVVLDVRGTALAEEEKDLRALVAAVTPSAHQGPLPTLSERLPLNGLEERSDHYILGPVTLNHFLPISPDDWLGFSQGAEAELAFYQLRGHHVTLLVADFPTPEMAANKLKEIEQQGNVNKDPSANPGNLYAKRSLTLLVMVAGAHDRVEADTLLQQVHTGEEVTWNEPAFEFKEPPITTMIVGAIIGTGVICCFAVISGLAFGGFRLVMKRLLPDKVFDRSSQLQVLQLGLSSKPINSEDFYGLGPSARKR
jgi:hypothetical protein